MKCATRVHNLAHGIVPEVYYLHEVCHSCTNLVHGIVPEVYYLHKVCHLCTNLVHGIVLEEQWIWPIRDVAQNWRARSQKQKQKQCSLGDLSSVWENCILACTTAFVHSPHGRWCACVLFKIVSSSLGTSFAWKRRSHDVPWHAGQGGSKTRNQACCACAHSFGVQCRGMDYIRQAHFM